MKKGLRLLFIFALLITLVACGDREIPTFDDILNQTVNVGSDARNWEDLLENLSDNETPVDALVIEVEENVNYDVPGTYNVTITVTDESDNVASVNFTVTVVDNVKPVITLVGQASMSLIEGESFTDPGATFTDNVDGTGSANVSGTVNTAVAGTYTLTYNYTDAAGNAADAVTRTVTVVPLDNEAPIISLTGEAMITIEAGSTFTDPGAIFVDNLDGTGPAVVSGTVDVNTLGFYTLTYNYTDAQGNVGTPVYRAVSVVDTTAPVITVSQSSYTIEVGSTFSLPTATASDNLDADVTVNATGTVDTATLGTYTLTYTHTDSQGNAATAVTVTVVVEDNTAPVVTLNGNAAVTLEAGATFTDAGATATDNYDSTATVVVSGTVNNAALGTYTLTYTSTDASGNVGTATRTVTVVDTTAPVISVTGGENITVQIGETYTDQGATFTDNLDASGNATVASTSDTVDTATVGTYTITYTVTDSSGNTSTATRTVIVSDTPPRFSLVVEEGYTMVVTSYLKYPNADVFVLRYTSQNASPLTKIVIFNDQTLVYERDFSMALNKEFNGIYNISENGFMFRERNIGAMNSVANLVYNVNTNTISEISLAGELRSFGPTTERYLSDADNYYYIVNSGEDKGLYVFKEDLTLEKVISIQGVNYNYIPVEDVPNSNLRIIEMSANNGMESFNELLIVDKTTNTVIKSFFYSNSTANPNVGERGFIEGIIDGKLVISTYTYGENYSQQIYVYDLSGTEVFSYEVERYKVQTESQQYNYIREITSFGFVTKSSSSVGRKAFIYNDAFDIILEETLETSNTADFYFDQTYAYFIERDSSIPATSLTAYPLNGSPSFSPNASDYDSSSLEYTYALVNSDFDATIKYVFTQRTFDSSTLSNTVKYFYVENGRFYSFESSYTFYDTFTYNQTLDMFLLTNTFDSWIGSEYVSKLRTLFANESNDTVVELESDVLSFTSGGSIPSYKIKQSGVYVINLINDRNSYSSTKMINLYNLETKTVTSHVFDTPLGNDQLSSFSIDQDGKVTIVIGQPYNSQRFTLTSTVANFSADMVVTEGGSSGSGNFVDTFLINDIITGVDLKITRTDGEYIPPNPPQSTFKFEFNNQVVEISVAGGISLFRVDLEGTENDAIYVRVSNMSGSYFVNLLDPQLTQIQGAMTFEGIFSIDENFNETLITEVTIANYIEYYTYLIND